MSQSPPTTQGQLGEAGISSALILDRAGRIGIDQPCMNCGYVLRGLLPNGVCPECSYSIELSSRGTLLQYAELGWLRRVVRGMGIILVSMIIIVLVSMAVGLSFALFGAAGGMMGGPSARLIMWMTLVPAIPVVVFVIGVWMFTSPDPSRAADEKPLSARNLARWLVFASILGIPLQMLGSSNPTAFITGGLTTIDFIVMSVSFITQIISMIAFVAGLLYLGTLARRIPRPALATQLKVGAWGLGATQIVMLAVSAGFLFMLPSVMAAAAAAAPPPPPPTAPPAQTSSVENADDAGASASDGATSPAQAPATAPAGAPAPPAPPPFTMSPGFLALGGLAGCGGLLQFAVMIWMVIIVVMIYFKLRSIVIQRTASQDAMTGPAPAG